MRKYKIIRKLYRGEYLVRYIDGKMKIIENAKQYNFSKDEEKDYILNYAKRRDRAYKYVLRKLF